MDFLIFVEVLVNGKKSHARVNSRASYNFIKKKEVTRLEFLIKKCQGWLKTVNSEAKPLDGIAYGVEIQLGTWKCTVDFSVAPTDEFNIVLGMEFLTQFYVVSLHH